MKGLYLNVVAWVLAFPTAVAFFWQLKLALYLAPFAGTFYFLNAANHAPTTLFGSGPVDLLLALFQFPTYAILLRRLQGQRLKRRLILLAFAHCGAVLAMLGARWFRDAMWSYR